MKYDSRKFILYQKFISQILKIEYKTFNNSFILQFSETFSFLISQNYMLFSVSASNYQKLSWTCVTSDLEYGSWDFLRLVCDFPFISLINTIFIGFIGT